MILGDKHGTCRLCLSKAKLCASHIVPEFCYDYEQTGNARKAFEFEIPADGAAKLRTIQKGHREYLLCLDCEQVLCDHEGKFASYLREVPIFPDRLVDGQLV